MTSPEVLAAIDAELRRHPDDPKARARIVLDVVRRSYDTVKAMVGPDVDTDERSGLGRLTDVAYDHEARMERDSPASGPASAPPLAPRGNPPEQTRAPYQESPEQLRRPIGSYDPTEPMVIPYADLIAARNAAAMLASILGEAPDPDNDYVHRWAMYSLRAGVTQDGERHNFDSFEETHQWILGLRDRLTGLLPDPPSGSMN